MSDVAAAIGLGQLHKAEQFLEGRRRCAERYLLAFQDLDFVDVLTVKPYVHSAWHLMVIQLVLEKLSIDRSEFIVQLNEAGIGTSVHYTPLHLHPFYQTYYDTQPEDFPVATANFERIISLPLYPDMSDSQVDRVVAEVRRIGEAKPAMKRCLDIVLSLMVLLLLGPLMLLCAVLVKLTSKGPILFCQTRVGRNFNHFTILKFRTMRELSSGTGEQVTVDGDHRITAMGWILRKTKFG